MKKLLLILFFVIPFAGKAQYQKDTIPVYILCSSKNLNNGPAYSTSAWEVREKHNTSEGVNDHGFYLCVDSFGNSVSCYSDYWKHVKYLDRYKKDFSSEIIIWQSTEK